MRQTFVLMGLVASVALWMGCRTGPNVNSSGATACQQLRACACDADGGNSLRAICNQMDQLEATDAGQDLCGLVLTAQGQICGEPLELNQPAPAPDSFRPGAE